MLWTGTIEEFLLGTPAQPSVDLVVTSPPYNIGKVYEKRTSLDKYLEWQESIIRDLASRVKESGSICWQVGNYVEKGQIVPLDIEFHPIFRKLGLKLRNRIVWLRRKTTAITASA